MSKRRNGEELYWPVGLIVAAVLTVALKGGVALADHWIAWWAAALIAGTTVFGGYVFLGDDHDWFH